MAKRWVVVAHRAGARVYESRGPGSNWDLVFEDDHDAGRAKAGELATDKPGQVFESAAPGQRPIQPTSDPTRVVAQRYARSLAKRLIDGRVAGSFDGLVLVAAPRFLGLLRAELDDPTRRMVDAEKALVLTEPDPERVRTALEDVLLV